MGRRDEVISAAVALIKTEGPDALTSVSVARALGLSQSAIYRHVRDMDELTTLASQIVVGELTEVMFAAAASPETTWGDGTHVKRFSERIVALMRDHLAAFAVIDRWRYHPGELGEGIRSLLDSGAHLVAPELERAWRKDFGFEGTLDGEAAAAQLVHAQLIIDDVVAIARTLRGPAEVGRIERILSLRLFAGWVGYVQEMNRRYDLALPMLGGPTASSPVGDPAWARDDAATPEHVT